MGEDIVRTGARHVDEVRASNRNLLEKSLEMRCLAYLSQVKAKLLTETIFEVDGSKKNLKILNDDLSQQNEIISKQKRELSTQLKELAQARQELEIAHGKLQEVDRLKSLFIASMSHELRTPLNSVIGFSSILLNEWLGPLNDEQKNGLSTILRSGNHLLSLITDVIDASKIEAGVLAVVRTDFDAVEMLDELEQTFAPMALEHNLHLSVQKISLALKTDRRRLLQCLINLVSNAIKYTPKGEVKVLVQHQKAQHRVKFEVVDTGIGIAKEDQSRLFEAFSRIPSKHSVNILGTGLGLYLTKKIVAEVLHGEISLSSAPQKGSSFCITIPCQCEDELPETKTVTEEGA